MPAFPWIRLLHGQTPIYVSTEEPHWFVPTSAADALLAPLAAGFSPNGDPRLPGLLARLPQVKPLDYAGRAAHLTLERISELWFHLTNRCNMACRHCLFASSPSQHEELPLERVLDLAAQAHAAGCRLFALTGGEPLVHPHIDAIVSRLLAPGDTHVVMLSNGLDVIPFLDRVRPDPESFHLQLSLDGLESNHDALRGAGAFRALTATLAELKARRFPFTLSMCVTAQNVREMADVAEFAHRAGAGNLHFMWYFVRGRGRDSQWAPPETILPRLIHAAERAEALGLAIDNLEALKTQVFAPAGTIHDGGTAGWESLAVGPDGRLYPTAALVGVPELATELGQGLVPAWKDSPVLTKIRAASAVGLTPPLSLLLGGGDIDHCHAHNRAFLGSDPYNALHEGLALWLIGREARNLPDRADAGLMLQMGEILESCGAHGKVALTHSNCLLATVQADSLTTIKTFYAQAVGDTKKDILNPVCHDPLLISHIPERFRFRGYGCGSPVLDAAIKPGEHVVDLGCGSGVECFIASRLSGPGGRVTGVDMLGPMLDLAKLAHPEVARNLGHDTLDFRHGYLEALPLDDASADVVLSNCVMNLSVHKRRAYAEILRVLRPGGRLVISDVVCETEPDPAIRNDEILKGECIAGALTITHLMALLAESGFTGARLIKRFPYRRVRGHDFFSLTYEAFKPAPSGTARVIYRGPAAGLRLDCGQWLARGAVVEVDRHTAEGLGDHVFVLDADGNATNVEAVNTCACFTPVDTAQEKKNQPKPASGMVRLTSGCMACGAPLVYAATPSPKTCVYCGQIVESAATCTQGHFVCDACHAQDALDVIRHICAHSQETDLIAHFARIRGHPSVPMHGPEYHAMIPAIILTAYRNSGGQIGADRIEAAITRGRGVAGGFCGFMGVCGAAVGVGIAFSLILDATPIKALERKRVQGAVQAALTDIARFKAARCCQRDGWLALKKAAALSATLLPVQLTADHPLVCTQMHKNPECLGRGCPLHP